MRFGPSSFGFSAGVVLLLLGCGALTPDVHAQGMQRSTRSASSSETNTLEIFSTLKGLDEKDDGLKRLDDELATSLQPFIGRHSVPSPAQSSYQIPRVPVTKALKKEDVDKSRGWIWDAEESMSGKSKEDSALFPGFTSDGADQKKSSSSWGQYSKESKPQRANNAASRSQAESQTQSKSEDEDDTAEIAGAIGQAAKSLKGTLKARIEKEPVGSIFNPPPARSSVADFFGQSIPTPPTAVQIQAHKAYMDEYQKIIGVPVLNNSSADFFRTVPSPIVPGNSQGLDTLPSSPFRHNGVAAASSGLIPSAPVPTTVPDANANVLNQWNPFYSPTKPELSKPAPFFQQPMDFPRRKF